MLIRDKIILFTICVAFYLPGRMSVYAVVPLIIAVTAAALNSWLERDELKVMIYLVYIAACLARPELVFFLPLLSFDLFTGRFWPVVLTATLPLAWHRQMLTLELLLQLVLLFLLAWFVRQRAASLEQIRAEANQLRDEARERTLGLEQKNKELLEKQDYEVNLATLNERNRIAREIHDHVGHLLTRSMLHLGAVMTTVHDQPLRDNLQILRDTLSDSMNAIRSSLHDLHDSSIDLHTELRKMVQAYQYCPVDLQCDASHRPDIRTVYAFLAITREALSNIARHSQATRAWITVREHPGFNQLIIRDNGIGLKTRPGEALGTEADDAQFLAESASGIGLKNMVERVSALGGQINFRQDHGLVIFITIPRSTEKRQT